MSSVGGQGAEKRIFSCNLLMQGFSGKDPTIGHLNNNISWVNSKSWKFTSRDSCLVWDFYSRLTLIMNSFGLFFCARFHWHLVGCQLSVSQYVATIHMMCNTLSWRTSGWFFAYQTAGSGFETRLEWPSHQVAKDSLMRSCSRNHLTNLSHLMVFLQHW